MRVWIASLVILGLACSKGPAQKAERASTRGSANVDGPHAQAEALRPTVVLTPAKAKAFVSYMEQFSALWKKWRADEQKRASKDAGAVRDSSLPAPDPAQAAALQTQLQEARDKVGLSQPELETLQNLATLVQANRSIKPETMDEKITEFAQHVAMLPPSERAEGEQQLAEMRNMRDNVVDMRDARAAYGDDVINTLLAEWPTLSRLMEDL